MILSIAPFFTDTPFFAVVPFRKQKTPPQPEYQNNNIKMLDE